MATVTLRQIKGSPLTNAELDANLTNINAETVDNSTVYRLRPSLDVDLVGSKTVSPLLSFSRGSTGTYYDGRTVAKAEENLFVRSGQFDSGTWGKSSSAVTADTVVAPDGNLSAEKLTEIDATTYHIVYQTVASESKPYTFSVYAKAAERGWMTLWYSGSGGFERWSYFDLTNGVVGTKQADVTSSISSVGNGWYRCSITLTAQQYTAPNWIIGTSNADNGNPYFGFLGVVNSGIYIWGAQLEQRSSVTAYNPTTSTPITNYIPQLLTAPTNTPRFDHDPVTGELKGMIVEESRTNLWTYSDQFDISWSKNNVSVASNVAIAPDGTLTATKIYENTSADVHRLSRGVSLPVYTQHTVSFFAKAAERSVITFYSDLVGAYTVRVNLLTGAVTNNVGGNLKCESVGNGWWRISYFGNVPWVNRTDSICLVNASDNSSYAGDGVSGIYIWGAQLEAGSQATSYIPTPLTYTSRNSTATYKGEDGYLKTAAINEARYERNALGGRQLLLEGAANNSLIMTERFDDGNWSKTNTVITPNAALAPNGLWSADKLTPTTSNAIHSCGISYTYNAAGGVASIFVKSAGARYFGLRTKSTSPERYAFFDFQNIQSYTLGNSATSNFSSVTIADAGNGWYRISLQDAMLGGASTNSFGIYVLGSQPASSGGFLESTLAYAGDGVSGIYIWGAQIEVGSAVTSYMPSTETFTSRASTATYFNSSGVLTTAAIDTARTGYTYDASRNQWVSQGLILEPAATNLLTYSEQFDNGFWAKNGVTTPSSTRIVESTGSNVEHNVFASIASAAGATYTFSVECALSSGVRYAAIQIAPNNADASTGRYTVVVDLTNGVVTSEASGTGVTGKAKSVTPTGSGKWRIAVSATHSSGTVYGVIGMSNSATPTYNASSNPTYTGDGTSSINIWGAQLETGSVATSYIPTTTAQVTRAADVYTSTAGSRAADVYSSSAVTRSADQLSISKTSNWFNSVNGTLALAHDAASGQPLLGDGATTVLSSLGAGTINIDYSNSQLSVVTQSGQTTATQGIFNFDSDLQILGNSTTKANARIKYMKFYPNNVIGSTPDGSGFILDDGFAMLQEDGSVLFQE